MDEFLTKLYKQSKINWWWLETKITELGIFNRPGYKCCFVLYKTNMFSITWKAMEHKSNITPKYYKLFGDNFQINSQTCNTMHLADLSRNVLLYLDSGKGIG